jgi:hypothetical protein
MSNNSASPHTAAACDSAAGIEQETIRRDCAWKQQIGLGHPSCMPCSNNTTLANVKSERWVGTARLGADNGAIECHVL